MYKPMSYNVIRQALSFSPIPDPLTVRMVSSYKWPDGTTSGEYILSFDGGEIREAFDRPALYDGSAAFESAKDAIREAFCSDVTPVRAWCDAQTDKMFVEIYCRVAPWDNGFQPQLPEFEVM